MGKRHRPVQTTGWDFLNGFDFPVLLLILVFLAPFLGVMLACPLLVYYTQEAIREALTAETIRLFLFVGAGLCFFALAIVGTSVWMVTETISYKLAERLIKQGKIKPEEEPEKTPAPSPQKRRLFFPRSQPTRDYAEVIPDPQHGEGDTVAVEVQSWQR